MDDLPDCMTKIIWLWKVEARVTSAKGSPSSITIYLKWTFVCSLFLSVCLLSSNLYSRCLDCILDTKKKSSHSTNAWQAPILSFRFRITTLSSLSLPKPNPLEVSKAGTNSWQVSHISRLYSISNFPQSSSATFDAGLSNITEDASKYPLQGCGISCHSEADVMI